MCCQQDLILAVRHVWISNWESCRLLWYRLSAAIRSYHLYFTSPEISLFNAAALHHRDCADDLISLRACRRMGGCLSANSKASLPQFGRKASRRKGDKNGRVDLLKWAIRTNGSSNIVCLYTRQGRKGVNQDAMIALEGGSALDDLIICGVFDGHGPFGHLVAQNVRDSLPLKLISSWQAIKSSIQKVNVEGGGSIAEDLDVSCFWRQYFLACYKSMDKELLVNPTINCFSSGTTAVTLIKQGNDVVIGNVGDSRAVLGTRSDDGSTVAVQITVDIKPNLPEEAERITKCKGRVFALHDEPDVYRVWLPHINSPGLAMARAFGDFCLKNFGVIAVPEVTHRHLTEMDEFIVLATDGIWDVLSNEQVVEIVSSVSARQLAAKAVVDTAVHIWKTKYPDSKTDDCAAVCLYINEDSSFSCLSSTRENYIAFKDGQENEEEVYTSSGNLTCKGDKTEQAPAGVLKNSQDDGAKLTELPGGGDVNRVEDEWSALVGVTRVNSLINLPRFSTRYIQGG